MNKVVTTAVLIISTSQDHNDLIIITCGQSLIRFITLNYDVSSYYNGNFSVRFVIIKNLLTWHY